MWSLTLTGTAKGIIESTRARKLRSPIEFYQRWTADNSMKFVAQRKNCFSYTVNRS